MEEKKKVVVAFSGGLDTSFTVMYLAKEKGYEVYAACANTGGFSEEQLKRNEENAYKLGAVKYVTIDVTQEYYEKSLKYMIFGNVLRNGTYPISVSSERIFQALAMSGDLSIPGDRKHVRIIREIDGKPQVLEFDIRSNSIIESEYYYIYPNDLIYVQRASGSFYKFSTYSGFISLITSSISLLITVLYYIK